MLFDYDCQIVTPMFMGGADPLKAELRAPAIKGALRFWWRALNGALPTVELREKEGSLFGSTSAGQSKVKISIVASGLKRSIDPLPRHPVAVTSKGREMRINILDYLCYGTYQWIKVSGRNEFTKEYLQPGRFKLRIRVPESIAGQEEEIKKALYLLANFGGLGSRSRNGFGSIFIDDEYFKINPKAFISSLDLPANKLDYSALSTGVKLFKTKEFQTWDGALAELGKAYRACRSNLEPKHNYEKRQHLASPLIVGKSFQSEVSRRAKPYFMHVAKVGDSFEGWMLYLPAKFAAGLKNPKIDHNLWDSNFEKVCNEMNTLLADHLEVVI